MKKTYFIIIVFLLSGNLCFSQIGGYALDLDGTNDYVTLPSGVYFDDNTLTVEAWVYLRSYNNFSRLIDFACGQNGGNNNVIVAVSSGTPGKPMLDIYNGSSGSGFASTTTIPLNTWAHLACVLNGSTGYIYINGVQTGYSTTANTPQNVTRTYNYIGKSNWTGDGYANMKVDELRIWSTARTANEIKSTMYKELNGNESGLLAYYKMSNGSGTTLSDNKSGGTLYNGTLVNGPVWKASGCFSGPRNALDFDGYDDYVSITNGVVLGTAFTQEIWIYPTDASAVYRGILGQQISQPNSRPPSIYQYGKKIHYGFGNGSTWYSDTTSSDVLTINAWNHIAVTFNGTTYLIYVNGRLVHFSSCASGITPISNTQNWIGKVDNYFIGKIDEVRIWSLVRTESQIRESMMSTLAGNETGLQAYYRMDYSDGTTLYDITSNARNGTLTNMDPATDWVSSSAFNTWIGSESSAWSTASNWSKCSVPASTENAGIYKWALGNELNLSGTPTSNHIIITSTSSPTLSSNFTANGELILNRDLNLNGYTITLGSNGYLNEGNYRLYGTSGTITTTRTLNNISASNVAGLGATITTSANMGSTTITRGHTTQGTGLSISRYYDITPTNNTGLNASLVFTYNDNEMNGNTETDLKLFKSTNSGTNWTVQNSSTVNTTNNTITQTGIDGFSRWTAADYNSPMLVELISFTSKVTGRDIKLNWATSKETNNKGFQIERKNSGNDWIYTGYVVGKGTTGEITNYIFEDKNLNTGKYNYRLKQIDFNGNYTYFNLNGAVEISTPAKFSLSQNYPNPFNPTTNIKFEIAKNSNVILKVYDLQGKEITILVNEKLRAGYYEIPFSNNGISSGVYLYRLEAGDYITTKKMILIK